MKILCLTYAELVHRYFGVYYILLLLCIFILLFFESLILKLQLKILIYLLKKIIVVYSEVKSLSHVRLFATAWTVTHQTPWSMGFSRQEHWSGLPFPSPGDLPKSGIEPGSPALQTDALPSEPHR